MVRLVALALPLVPAAVRAAPTITRQPQDVAITSGQNATFVVAAEGTGILSVQWRRQGNALPGATSATFVIPGATRAAADFYDAVVTDATGATTTVAARLTVAPRSYPTFVRPDPAWQPLIESQYTGWIDTVASDPQGGYFAAGIWRTINGVLRHNVFRATSTGLLDPNFVPPAMDGAAYHVAPQSDGKVMIAGSFTRVDGTPRHGIARLLRDGRLDPTFQPPRGGFYADVQALLVEPGGDVVYVEWPSTIRRLGPDGFVRTSFAPPNGIVRALARRTDGKLIAIGSFIRPGKTGEAEGVVLFNADGSIDSTFASPTIEGGDIRAVVALPEGGIVIGGHFTSVGGETTHGLARLDAAGARDPEFVSSAGRNVHHLALEADENLLVACTINTSGSYEPVVDRLTLNGELRARLAPVTSGEINRVASLANGDIVVGGYLEWSQNGVSMVLSPAGIGRPGSFMRAQQGGEVTALAVMADGKLLLGGEFTTIDGGRAEKLVRYHPDGTRDVSFRSRLGDGLNERVNDVALLPDGRIVIAGQFESYDGVPAGSIAVLHPNGELDPTFSSRAGLHGWEILSIAVLPGGRIAAAGTFSGVGNESRGRIAFYQSDGRLEDASGPGFNDTVNALLALRDGSVVAGGNFTSYNGTAVHGLARLRADGSLDTTFVANLNGAVTAIALGPEDHLYVGGQYYLVDGVPHSGLARLRPDGEVDPTFRDPQLYGGVMAVLPQEDGGVLAYLHRPQINAELLVKLRVDATSDPDFKVVRTLPPRWTARLAVRDDGQVVVAHGHQLFVTQTATAPVLVSTPTPEVLELGGSTRLSVAVSEDEDTTFQWFRNGTPIDGATAAEFVITDFNASLSGHYSVRVTNPFGQVTTPEVRVGPPLYEQGRLVNLSIRSRTGSGDQTVIVGFVIGGAGTAGSKPLLLRGVGPTLGTTFNVTEASADTRIDLYDATDFRIDQNDNWQGVFDFASVGAFPFAGSPVRDAALYNPFSPAGRFSMHLLAARSGVDDGVALAEIYDGTAAEDMLVFTPRLVNVSARAVVGTGDAILIAGFVIAGNTNARVLVRAAGPALATAPFGVAGALVDPVIALYNQAGEKLAENDDWSGDEAAALADAFAKTGAFAFPTGSADAAIIASLPPGLYTAQIRGKNGGTGVSLVEVYELTE